ncbi:T9SS type A sorting domain-containing protein, partial [Bacteroidales bacterium OttesenSCG-928-L19]|nr:T9SS type A sorting domain-containing protein [Bacteroidales bacterium OttesenSCG-928-L19]
LTTVGDAVNTDWLLYESILPEGTQYIAIHYNTGNNANELYIDDITIHYAHQLTASVSHYHDYGTTPVAAIAPENAYVIHNESKEVTITIEDPAYDLYALLMTVGGEEPIDITDAATQTGNVYSYMVNNITEDTHVEAVIKVKDFTLNFTVQSGKGEVNGVFYDATTTPQTFQQTVNYEYSFMLDPDYGYVVEDLIIDGVSVGTSEQYDFEHIVADHQVDIYFAPGTFIITTEVVEGEGSISQGDTFVFDPDYVFDFEVEANEDAGFRIAYITIDDQVIPGTIGAELLSYNGSIPAPIGENHSIKAYFGNVSIIYTIHSGNGYIENMPNVVTVTDEPEIIQIWSVAGTDHLAYFSPDIGYQIGQVLINGVDFNTIDEYLFENVTEAQYVDIYFERKTYTITTQTYGNGTIIPGDTSFLFDPDYVYEYTILPDEGYNISSILINGDTVEFTDPEIFTGTLENIIENYLIEAYFTIKQFTVTATAHEGGSINPEGTAVYDWNSSPEYTATPSEGYYISEILLDGEPQTIDDNQLWSYTFTNINADHTIEVTFDRLAYTITVVQGENGTISPGTSSVYWGESMSFTITPGLGYLIENVIVDGVNMGAISNYTFTDVREPHTITASFEIRTFTVTAIQPENGTITPAGVTTVNYNENATYTITPNVGYEIISITVNGIAVAGSFDDEGVATYTISGITENKEITATLIPRTYTITVENTENGTITPGTSVVEHGEAISFTITPAPRYEIARLIIDGNDTTPEPTYTFTNVTANHTIRAEFILTPCEKPSNLYAGDITHESAILHWDDIGAESYIVEYKAIDAPYFNAAIATTNQYAYTNLLEQTTYVWRVMAVCEIGYESEWTELSTFTTLESSIRDNALSQISVYAHQNHVNIVNEAGIAIKQIDIFDIYGRQIYRGKTSESREVITLSVTSGTYMVRLVTNQGVGIYKV